MPVTSFSFKKMQIHYWKLVNERKRDRQRNEREQGNEEEKICLFSVYYLMLLNSGCQPDWVFLLFDYWLNRYLSESKNLDHLQRWPPIVLSIQELVCTPPFQRWALFHSHLNLVWLCDFLWLTECSRWDTVPALCPMRRSLAAWALFSWNLVTIH